MSETARILLGILPGKAPGGARPYRRALCFGKQGLVTRPRVLLAEPDGILCARFRDAVGECSEIAVYSDFLTARTSLLAIPFHWVITNLRLEAYNGLHLLHVARAASLPARFLIYADRSDLTLAQDAQRAGAFYESLDAVPRAVAAYLRGMLPPKDRRDPAAVDRRAIFRGSRRRRDLTPK
jgi:hypothetical protein